MSSSQTPFFYRSKTKKALFAALIFCCVFFVCLELFIHRYSYFAKTGWMSWDGKFGFYALLGILAPLLLILVARILSIVLKVRTDYYDEHNG